MRWPSIPPLRTGSKRPVFSIRNCRHSQSALLIILGTFTVPVWNVTIHPVKRLFDPVSLRMFVAVCEERNIARAAEREAIVASAISKRIAALEADVGVTLIKRGRRGIEPTPAGEAMLRQAREVLDLMETMRARTVRVRDRRPWQRARVREPVRAVRIASRRHRRLPGPQPDGAREPRGARSSSEIARGVREGIADLGVCWDAGDLAGLTTLPYRRDHMSVVVPAAHPLARRKRVAFADTLSLRADRDPGRQHRADDAAPGRGHGERHDPPSHPGDRRSTQPCATSPRASASRSCRAKRAKPQARSAAAFDRAVDRRVGRAPLRHVLPVARQR